MIIELRQKFAHLTPARGIEMIATSETQLYRWEITFHKVQHGANGYSYAIRFAGREKVWIYMPDAFQVTEEQFDALRGADLLIIGAAFWKENAEPHRRSIYDVNEQRRKMVLFSRDVSPLYAALPAWLKLGKSSANYLLITPIILSNDSILGSQHFYPPFSALPHFA